MTLPDLKTFGERFKFLRKQAGYTQEELAQRLGVTKGAIAMWETNKRMPSMDKMFAICEYLECEYRYLLNVKTVKVNESYLAYHIRKAKRCAEIVNTLLSLDEFSLVAVEALVDKEKERCIIQENTDHINLTLFDTHMCIKIKDEVIVDKTLEYNI